MEIPTRILIKIPIETPIEIPTGLPIENHVGTPIESSLPMPPGGLPGYTIRRPRWYPPGPRRYALVTPRLAPCESALLGEKEDHLLFLHVFIYFYIFLHITSLRNLIFHVQPFAAASVQQKVW